MKHHRLQQHHLNMKQTNRGHGEPARGFRRTVPQTLPVNKSFPGLKTHHTNHGDVHRKPTMGATTNQTRCAVSTTSSPNKQDSRCGCARAVGETTPTTSCPLQAAMSCSCLGTGWRGFSAHMSCTVTLRPFASTCASRAQNDIREKGDGRHLSCLSARATREGRQCTSTSDTVVRNRKSRVYNQTSPTKTDGVSESVQCVHERALGDSQSLTCPPPVLAQRCTSYELASDLERRTAVRHLRYPEATRQRDEDE